GVFAHKIAGTGAGLDQAAVFQQVVGREYGGRADAIGAAGMAYRGHLLAGAEHAGTDQLGDLVGKFFVAFHRVLVHRRKGYGRTLYGVNGRHGSASRWGGRTSDAGADTSAMNAARRFRG